MCAKKEIKKKEGWLLAQLKELDVKIVESRGSDPETVVENLKKEAKKKYQWGTDNGS